MFIEALVLRQNQFFASLRTAPPPPAPAPPPPPARPTPRQPGIGGPHQIMW